MTRALDFWKSDSSFWVFFWQHPGPLAKLRGVVVSQDDLKCARKARSLRGVGPENQGYRETYHYGCRGAQIAQFVSWLFPAILAIMRTMGRPGAWRSKKS